MRAYTRLFITGEGIMSFSIWLATPTIALVPLFVMAQSAVASDAATTVAPTTLTPYQSPFKSYRAAPDVQTSADQHWLQANRQLLQDDSSGNAMPAMTDGMAMDHSADQHAAHRHGE
jgi:hypothetical protein